MATVIQSIMFEIKRGHMSVRFLLNFIDAVGIRILKSVLMMI